MGQLSNHINDDMKKLYLEHLMYTLVAEVVEEHERQNVMGISLCSEAPISMGNVCIINLFATEHVGTYVILSGSSRLLT